MAHHSSIVDKAYAASSIVTVVQGNLYKISENELFTQWTYSTYRVNRSAGKSLRVDHNMWGADSSLLCINRSLENFWKHESLEEDEWGVRFASNTDSLYLRVITIIRKSGTMKTPGVSGWFVYYMSSALLYFRVHSLREKSSSNDSLMQKVEPHVVEVGPRGCSVGQTSWSVRI